MNNKYNLLIVAAMMAALTMLSFGGTAVLIKIVCWAFGLTFKWRYAIGIWLGLVLLGDTFKGNSK